MSWRPRLARQPDVEGVGPWRLRVVRLQPRRQHGLPPEATSQVGRLGLDRDYDGSYFDYDFYATINFNNNAGVTGGWRKLDLDYTVKEDFGSLDLRGLYVLGVVRF